MPSDISNNNLLSQITNLNAKLSSPETKYINKTCADALGKIFKSAIEKKDNLTKEDQNQLRNLVTLVESKKDGWKGVGQTICSIASRIMNFRHGGTTSWERAENEIQKAKKELLFLEPKTAQDQSPSSKISNNFKSLDSDLLFSGNSENPTDNDLDEIKLNNSEKISLTEEKGPHQDNSVTSVTSNLQIDTPIEKSIQYMPIGLDIEPDKKTIRELNAVGIIIKKKDPNNINQKPFQCQIPSTYSFDYKHSEISGEYEGKEFKFEMNKFISKK